MSFKFCNLHILDFDPTKQYTVPCILDLLDLLLHLLPLLLHVKLIIIPFLCTGSMAMRAEKS